MARANGSSKRPSFLGLVFGRLLFWAPVWVPLIVVFQLVLSGLKPTQAEGRRVRGAEDEVLQRVEDLESEREDLQLRRDMLADPIYRARVDRTRQRADREPLTLDDARELETDGAGE
ncbi:MAG: hypothetical protein ACI8QS_001099 [Planctomycetota bacterium]|jgi:hypothetical protein